MYALTCRVNTNTIIDRRSRAGLEATTEPETAVPQVSVSVPAYASSLRAYAAEQAGEPSRPPARLPPAPLALLFTAITPAAGCHCPG